MMRLKIALFTILIINISNIYCNENNTNSDNNKKDEDFSNLKKDIYTLDLDELERDIIPTSEQNNQENSKTKINTKINMVIVNTKYTKLAVQNTLERSNKIDIISPQWFTMIGERKTNFVGMKIEGHKFVNKDYIMNYKAENINGKIMPVIDCNNSFQFLSDQKSYITKKSVDTLTKDLAKRIKYYKIDGFILDCLDLQSNEEFKEDYIYLIEEIGKALHKEKAYLGLVIQPFTERYIKFVNSYTIDYLLPYIDYVILNTLEYKKYIKRPIGYYNSPQYWIEKSVKEITQANELIKNKLIIVTPFHGMSYFIREGEKAIIDKISSDKFMSMVFKSKALAQKNIENKTENKDTIMQKWDDYAKEHLVNIYNEKGIYYISFPTKRSFDERIKMVKELDIAGLCINEFTEGFDQFMSNF